MATASSLVSTQNRVESPFIIVKIGNHTFGHCARKENRSQLGTIYNITYPNIMDSLNITKINGTVNIYTIKMVYVIREHDDPNMIEKVFSSVSETRKLKLSYGDWAAPGYIYKDEEAIITKIASNVDVQSSKITYTINCTSTALSLTAGNFNFPARYGVQPSKVLIDMLSNATYGLLDVFTGMKNILHSPLLANLIARDDRPVDLDKQDNKSPLEYMSYLVSCMVHNTDSLTGIQKYKYFWAVYDDINNEYGGAYFKVVRVSADVKNTISYSTYEVDVGYPSGTYVSAFSLNSDETWSILYKYSEKTNTPQYSYNIDNTGNVIVTESPSIMNATSKLASSNESRKWWSNMTQFPVSAKLVIRGLLRPAVLMSHLKVNVYFFGHKHISSGLYIITKQEDVIDSTGYKTTLSLQRISGDEHYE